MINEEKEDSYIVVGLVSDLDKNRKKYDWNN